MAKKDSSKKATATRGKKNAPAQAAAPKQSTGSSPSDASARRLERGDSIVTLSETQLSRDEGLRADQDRQWLLFEAASADVLQSEEVILTIKRLEKELRPMGVMMKTWAKPGMKS
jgi:hypothetical protein